MMGLFVEKAFVVSSKNLVVVFLDSRFRGNDNEVRA